MTPVPPVTASAATVGERRRTDQRRRLIRGVGSAVAAKGFAATTIADIVAEAHVSKRTFYEHFDDKLDCFLAAYRVGSEHLLRRMATAAQTDDPPLERLRVALRTYLAVLADTPAMTHTFTLEIQAAGPQALVLRRQMHERTATTLRSLVDDLRRDLPDLRPLDATMAAAVVGSLTELIMLAVADGRTEEVVDLDVPVLRLLYAVLTAPDFPGPAAGRPDHDREKTT